ncbi:Lecithin-cholesterol acyltransferase-like 4 [Acorus calamus]|uniref:Lecithin-cholesterol acyltransferase-like 4 n=1 Tax=Acorus calamus TaxID=4465 RepID=A0AAV9FKM7_ACOCL|nr:Lecithin-cholesterol acyltransferase-like 4 [Acorus calamus]
MGVVSLEELIKSIEVWLRLVKNRIPYVDPDLDPVLLVPGIAGSILNAVDANGREERVWVRILGADHEFRTKLWSRFDPSTGQTVSMDQKTKILVPEDRFGLYAIDVLDPDMIIGRDGVIYFHDMIEEMLMWGYQEGKTLFGFGYDFRQSNRLQETLDEFSDKLQSAYTAAGGKKLTIITHSMGGLLVKCFMCLRSDVFEKYVKSWIAIAAPFRGAPGYITTSLLNGMSFVEGWEQNFFISKWSMHQLLIECPSIYELMACPNFDWNTSPSLQVWREKIECGNTCTILESYGPEESISIMEEALSCNTVLIGTVITLLVCSYGSEDAPISDLKQILLLGAKYISVDGDGTVPAESAKADGLDAVARVGVQADHRGIVCDRHVFRILQHWLKAGEPDPFYNPIIDYVILPTAFEIEKHCEEGVPVTTMKEEWEMVSEDDDYDNHKTPHLVGSLFVSHTGKDESHAEAHVTVCLESESKQQVEVRAVSVSVGG